MAKYPKAFLGEIRIMTEIRPHGTISAERVLLGRKETSLAVLAVTFSPGTTPGMLVSVVALVAALVYNHNCLSVPKLHVTNRS